MMIWSQNQNQFKSEAKAEFARADNADAWVVAFAKAKNYIVVTHEQFDPKETKKRDISAFREEMLETEAIDITDELAISEVASMS